MSLIQEGFEGEDKKSRLISNDSKPFLVYDHYATREEIEIKQTLESPLQLKAPQDQSHLMRRNMRRISSDGR